MDTPTRRRTAVHHASRGPVARDCRPWSVSSVAPGMLLALTLVGAAGGANAQYKVVGPDGRITYTDRAPTGETSGKVSALKVGKAAPANADPLAGLPTELRAVAARFPVLLYTSTDCAPCGRARALLQQRGIPYAERSANGATDGEALQRLTGARTVPALVVGKQTLQGLQDADWHDTLDLAGYPRASALPRGWQPPAVRPLVADAPAGLSSARPAPEAETSAASPPAAPRGSGSSGNARSPGIRF